MADESARLNFARVRKLTLIDQEEVRSSGEVDGVRSRVQLGSVTSARGFVLGWPKILAQRPHRGRVPDVAPPTLKSMSRPRSLYEYWVAFILVGRRSTVPRLLMSLASFAEVTYDLAWSQGP
ncbi:hypothetical protein BHM03_00004818 [Ensete ventricosum]|nr:hypothetical protein BHM03_00004818 [Ensete ventricosum]